MKNTYLVIGIIVLIALAYFGWSWYQKNKTKEITSPNAPVPGIRRLAANQQSDYSEISSSGKVTWIWSGGLPCPDGYEPAPRGEDAGWCKLIPAQIN